MVLKQYNTIACLRQPSQKVKVIPVKLRLLVDANRRVPDIPYSFWCTLLTTVHQTLLVLLECINIGTSC